MKRYLALLLVALIMVSLSGCASIFVTNTQRPGIEPVTLPEPAPESILEAPTGDSRADRTQHLALYYLSSDLQQLVPLSRSINLRQDELTAEKAMERLLEGSSTSTLKQIVPENTKLEYLEISQSIATVSLSLEALTLDSQALCWMKSAIANTLTSIEGIQYANVLIHGKEESFTDMPTGTLTFTDSSLTAIWAQMRNDAERYTEQKEKAQISRLITLYFGAMTSERLLPEVRNISFSTGNIALDIFQGLKNGPEYSDSLPVIPSAAVLVADPRVVILEDGRRILLVSFSSSLDTLLEKDGISLWQLAGALSYTLCRSIPNIDGITIGVDGTPLTFLSGAYADLSFPDGVITPEAFENNIACMGTIYLSDGNGKLCPVQRALDQNNATSARVLLEELFSGPDYTETALYRVAPANLTDADIIGIEIRDSCALVNFSSNFYSLCQTMTQEQEFLMIYAIVNTLCTLEDVNRVRFYFAGHTSDTLAGWIYLNSELLPNPGIIRSQG